MANYIVHIFTILWSLFMDIYHSTNFRVYDFHELGKVNKVPLKIELAR